MHRIVPLALALLAGCVTEVTAGHPPATGKIRIETRVHTETFATREQVGTVQYSNAAGQPDGTAAIYANGTGYSSRLLWRPFRGDQPIADEDYFALLGDPDAALASHQYRNRGRWLVRIGFTATIAGAAAMIAGAVLPSWNLFFVGCGGFAIGPAVAYFGYAYQSPDNHAVPIDRAFDVLQRYEAQHAVSFTLPLVRGAF
jgi:hypothetical protein